MKKVIIIEFVLYLALGIAITYFLSIIPQKPGVESSISNELYVAGVALLMIGITKNLGTFNENTRTIGGGFTNETYTNMVYQEERRKSGVKTGHSFGAEQLIEVKTKNGVKYRVSYWSVVRKWMVAVLGVMFIAVGIVISLL